MKRTELKAQLAAIATATADYWLGTIPRDVWEDVMREYLGEPNRMDEDT